MFGNDIVKVITFKISDIFYAPDSETEFSECKKNKFTSFKVALPFVASIVWSHLIFCVKYCIELSFSIHTSNYPKYTLSLYNYTLLTNCSL